MNETKIFVFGAGGHGKVVGDILLACRTPDFYGYVDDDRDRKGGRVLGMPIYGDGEWLRAEAQRFSVAVVLGIGENHKRREVARRCEKWNIEIMTLVHRRATVALSAHIGAGTVLMAGAAVNPDARLGKAAVINTGAIVEHDCVVGDFADVAPNAAMGGAARIGAGSMLGIGAIILPGVCVGSGSVVGAGAVVVHDIPDNVVALGVPARVHREIAARLSLPTFVR